jgi:hypothetical protein
MEKQETGTTQEKGPPQAGLLPQLNALQGAALITG